MSLCSVTCKVALTIMEINLKRLTFEFWSAVGHGIILCFAALVFTFKLCHRLWSVGIMHLLVQYHWFSFMQPATFFFFFQERHSKEEKPQPCFDSAEHFSLFHFYRFDKFIPSFVFSLRWTHSLEYGYQKLQTVQFVRIYTWELRRKQFCTGFNTVTPVPRTGRVVAGGEWRGDILTLGTSFFFLNGTING